MRVYQHQSTSKNHALNRDTLYSFAVFNLDAGDGTITLPEVGKRYIMMQVIDQDHCSAALYLAGHSKNNDGKHIETLTLKDVPVDAFWSISNRIDVTQITYHLRKTRY